MSKIPFNTFTTSMVTAHNQYPRLFLAGFQKPPTRLDRFYPYGQLERLALLSIANHKLYEFAYFYFDRNIERFSIPVPVQYVAGILNKLNPNIGAVGKEGVILVAAKAAGMGITTDENSMPNLIFYDRKRDAFSQNKDEEIT